MFFRERALEGVGSPNRNFFFFLSHFLLQNTFICTLSKLNDVDRLHTWNPACSCMLSLDCLRQINMFAYIKIICTSPKHSVLTAWMGNKIGVYGLWKVETSKLYISKCCQTWKVAWTLMSGFLKTAASFCVCFVLG